MIFFSKSTFPYGYNIVVGAADAGAGGLAKKMTTECKISVIYNGNVTCILLYDPYIVP